MPIFPADSGFICPENSQVPNARFQAAAAIRDAAIREWGFLTADDRRSLIRLFYMLLFLSSLLHFTSLISIRNSIYILHTLVVLLVIAMLISFCCNIEISYNL